MQPQSTRLISLFNKKRKNNGNYRFKNNPKASINYQGHGAAFLKKDLSEPLQYCDDLDRSEADALFNAHETYYFGDASLEWTFASQLPMGKGKIAMWFAKYWKNGYYEAPHEG